MEYPITRARLQKIAEEVESIETENWINSVVESIRDRIILTCYREMKPFGGTREMKPFGGTFNGNRDQRGKLVVDLPFNLRRQQQNVLFTPNPQMQKTLTPLIVERLQALFPDTNFQIDPLTTYLLIDWS